MRFYMSDDWRNSHSPASAFVTSNLGDPPFPMYLQVQILQTHLYHV